MYENVFVLFTKCAVYMCIYHLVIFQLDYVLHVELCCVFF